MKPNKVFCIGLPKTGTTSMTIALGQLGYRTLHNPKEVRHHMVMNNYPIPGSQKWDALSNVGEWKFPDLDHAYPNSKFILTTRPIEPWLASLSKKNQPKNHHVRLEIFGCYFYNELRFRHIREQHIMAVTSYFHNRPNDLLIFDMFSGPLEANWSKLASFLGHPIPTSKFPSRKSGVLQ